MAAAGGELSNDQIHDGAAIENRTDQPRTTRTWRLIRIINLCSLQGVTGENGLLIWTTDMELQQEEGLIDCDNGTRCEGGSAASYVLFRGGGGGGDEPKPFGCPLLCYNI